MGHVLSHPIQSQLLQRRGNENYTVASSEMQGYRIAMEDCHTIALRLSDKHPEKSLFGVFDGHAGDKASLFLEQELCGYIGKLDDLSNKKDLEDVMVKFDETFLSRENERENGSTCVFAIVEPSKKNSNKKSKEQESLFDITVVNIGDSRAMIIRADGTCTSLTEDHKPENPEEQKRIESAGGMVQMNRVDGQLAMSRAIGDYVYKTDTSLTSIEQKVIPLPDITTDSIYPGDTLIICCDGIVEQMNNDDVAAIVYRELPNHKEDPAEILSILFKESLVKGSRDNHSALIIQFKNGVDYIRKDEFRPGPFTAWAKNDTPFEKEYLKDAKKHGYEGEILMKMIEDAEKSMPKLEAVSNGPQSAQKLQIIEQLIQQTQSGDGQADMKEKLMMFLSGQSNMMPAESNTEAEPTDQSPTISEVTTEIEAKEIETSRDALGTDEKAETIKQDPEIADVDEEKSKANEDVQCSEDKPKKPVNKPNKPNKVAKPKGTVPQTLDDVAGKKKKKKRKKKKKKKPKERKKDQPIPLCMFRSAMITGSRSDNQLREMLRYMDIHETDDSSRTSLMAVARCGKKNLVSDLLSMGAPIEAQNNDGWTALHLAAYFGYADVVEQIVNAGGASCTNIKDHAGDTPLHKCIQIEEIEGIVPHLIKAGAQFDIKNNQGQSPLDVAPTTECKEQVLQMINDHKIQNEN